MKNAMRASSGRRSALDVRDLRIALEHVAEDSIPAPRSSLLGEADFEKGLVDPVLGEQPICQNRMWSTPVRCFVHDHGKPTRRVRVSLGTGVRAGEQSKRWLSRMKRQTATQRRLESSLVVGLHVLGQPVDDRLRVASENAGAQQGQRGNEDSKQGQEQPALSTVVRPPLGGQYCAEKGCDDDHHACHLEAEIN